MQQYLELLDKIMTTGVDKTDRTGTGTRSIFGPQMRFNLGEGFPLVTTKKVHLKSIIHELLWFLKGDTNIKYLVDNGVKIWDDWPYAAYRKAVEGVDTTILVMDQARFIEAIRTDAEFAARWGNLGPVYGHQWINYGGSYVGFDGHEKSSSKSLNQVAEMVSLLRNQADSRRMVVSAWTPDELPHMALSTCHCLFQFYAEPLTHGKRETILHARERAERGMTFFQKKTEQELDAALIPKERLCCQLYQRSADTFLGVPFNIASYALLTQMMAQVVNMVPGEFIWTGGDTHIYSSHFEQVKLQLSRAPHKLPTMTLNPDVKDLFAFTYEDFTLSGYESHPAIKAPVAV